MTPSDLGDFEKHLRTMAFIAGKAPPAVWERMVNESQAFQPGSIDISVLYINLDAQVDRREHITNQLEALGLPYQRVPAIKEQYGLLGGLKSQIKALRLAKENGYLWTAIFEDDFAFTCSIERVREQINFMLENNMLAPVWMGEWIVNGPAPSNHSMYPGIKVANGACNSAACYFIRQDYIDVLLGTWENALNNLVTELMRRVEEKRLDANKEIGNLWWFSPDSAWAPQQIRDQWLLFNPVFGVQQYKKFASGVKSSMSEFDKTGYLSISSKEITTQFV
jgi:hypothetical protein